MLTIEDNIGALVAAETKGALKAVDDAILTELRLCATMVEAFGETGLPISSSQKLLQSLASGLNHFVAGRAEMAHTVRTLTAIKNGSSLAETSYSCPKDHPPLMHAGQAEASKHSHLAPSFG
jgi:hypothetical protein